MRKLSLSVVVPAYNASATIKGTLASILDAAPDAAGLETEIIVVDDGSDDSQRLEQAVAAFAGTRYVRHSANRGMCAARNTGIGMSAGDLVTVLDADDRLVDGWPRRLEAIVKDWPARAKVCFAACINTSGEVTASEPQFQGLLSFDDLLNERHSGEYLPIFRGEFIRRMRYVDLGFKKSCGIVSYLRFAQESPFWVSAHILRVYDDRTPGSVSSAWTSRGKARETVQCYSELMRRYGAAYKQRAPRIYRTKMLRLAVYQCLAGQRGAWRSWSKGVGLTSLPEAAASFVMLVLGPAMASRLALAAKRIGLVRRYG